MALTSALCTSFKVELLEGDQDFTNGADAYKVALMKALASQAGTYDASTSNYSDVTGNSAVCVINFGADYSVSGGTFEIQWPAADSSNAIIRIA